MRLRWLGIRLVDFDHRSVITERNTSRFPLCALRMRPR